MRTVYPPPPPRAPAGSAASTPASRCAPSRTIARTRAGSVRLILSYSAVSDTGRVAPAALTAAWIDGRNPNVTEASKSTTVENSSDRTYCRSACWANSASSHGAASARRSVRCVITVSGLRLTNRSTTASHPIRHLPTPRQRYLAGGHLERGASYGPTATWARAGRKRSTISSPSPPKERKAMSTHRIATREQWRAERLDLLEAEKDLTHRSDELARRRQELPWVKIDKDYRFDTDEGSASLPDLFKGRSQLLVYHFMFGPDYTASCPSCSAIADGFNGSVVHLANHDVTLYAVSRAPLAKLQAYKRRMGWSFPWASSFESDFNYDFHVSHTEEEWDSGAVEYNFREVDFRPAEESPVLAEWASTVGTDFATYRREGPGVSAFTLEDGVVYHSYSAYERGIDGLWGMYQWLDRAPLGRNETGFWWRRHDEDDSQ